LNSLPEKYDMESDVVVVGYGAAGSVAAITAHDNGASVLLLEKMPAGGGNSRVCGGNIIVPQSMEFTKYLKTLSYGTTEPEIIEKFVGDAMKNGDWIREMGGDITVFTPLRVGYPSTVAKASFPQAPGSDQMVKYNVKGTEAEGPPGQRLFSLLSSNVERRKIKVLTGTPAIELIRNEKEGVVGLMAEREGTKISIKARKAVILTCGGFEYDEALKWDNLPPKPVYAHGNPGNTGDGIRMAQKVGAALWHMTSSSCGIGFKAPEYEASFHISFLSPAFIFVDKHGSRFVDETGIEVHEFWRMFSFFDTHRIEFPRIPSYAIFSEEARRRGPLNPGTSGFNRDKYKWSLDNSQEIAKGWILSAKSISELASRISMDKTILENTITKYNSDCKAGRDADFGRVKERLRAVEGPPYYAVQVSPCLLNTQGGPRRDVESRVLDPDGKPIPRLYAAGELGSIWGYLYQGANNIGECIVFGKIAGKNAAAEKPWS
jgi:succinate dehydrogenase/fumarate reductase flavoprotein subunit